MKPFPSGRWRARALLTLSLAAVGGLGGCAKQVTRVSPEQAIDLSGRWNDADSRLVAEEIIRQSFEAGARQNWAVRFAQLNGGEAPTVIVGSIRNRSLEHVPIGTFSAELERAYVNSGLVQVVAGGSAREEIRDERFDQQEYAAADTRKPMRNENGADFILQGDVQSIEDREGRRSVVYYQVDLTLVDLESNAKVWAGQHRIKKFIERPRFRL